MPADKIILATNACDQGDILGDFIEWHLDLGIDLILVQDIHSVDETYDILESFADNQRVKWFTLPERDMRKYSAFVALATLAREQYGAEWIIQCDPDELLCPRGDDLRTILQKAKTADFTGLSVPVFNMTGRGIETTQRAVRELTLRIDRPVVETNQQQNSGELPVPYIFIRHPPKTIVCAAALLDYGPGSHYVTTTWGQSGEASQLMFLHYPIRGFAKLQKKVSNTAAWLDDNPHLPPEWGWHWRRWIRLDREGRLREDYNSQFVSPARAEELIRDGTCSIDETVAGWAERKEAQARGLRPRFQRWMRRVRTSLNSRSTPDPGSGPD
jgi:hypothetical protein